jgi:hypothetical protein
MEKELLFAVISIWIYLFGAIPYWRDAIYWRTIPHPFTQSIWLILIGFNGYVLWINQEYYALMGISILCFSIIVFGIGYGIRWLKKILINWFDYAIFILSIAILIYWYLSENTLNTVIMTGLIDFISFLPTIKKSWLQPWTETAFAYCTGILNILFLMLAQNSPNPETMIYWVTYIMVNSIVIWILISRRWYLKGYNSIFE